MTDIVERLRKLWLAHGTPYEACRDRANEIERLRTANASLRSFIETELNQMRAELNQ